MKGMNTAILTLSLLALAGNAAAIDWSGICCDGGYEHRTAIDSPPKKQPPI